MDPVSSWSSLIGSLKSKRVGMFLIDKDWLTLIRGPVRYYSQMSAYHISPAGVAMCSSFSRTVRPRQ
jgi:hypothetical protein